MQRIGKFSCHFKVWLCLGVRLVLLQQWLRFDTSARMIYKWNNFRIEENSMALQNPMNPTAMADQIAEIDPTRCSGCGRCISACEFRLFSFETKAWKKTSVLRDATLCSGCGECASRCVIGAISMGKKFVAGAGLSLLAMHSVLAQAPKQDLTIELRQVEDVVVTGYTVSTKSSNFLLSPQSVRVRNGEKASLSMGKTMTVQWLQSAQAQGASLSAPGTSASSNSGAVTHAMTNIKSGQLIHLHPSWPGAKQAVTVDVELESDTVDDRTGAEPPSQSHQRVVTTVSAPLGQWATIASSGAGNSQQAGVYGTAAASEPRRLLQIRVLAP